nr:hypothetical protein [uncultured Carboxylicivirga sp.]
MIIDNQLKENYKELEDSILPIKKFLQKNYTQDEYKKLYKGIMTVQSPIIYQPEILFIAINPGPGAYKKNSNKPVLRMIGEYERDMERLNWYETGNARKKSAWYQRNKTSNNSFVANSIDLLYELGRLRFPEKYGKEGYSDNSLPFWYDNFGQNIMYTNLYPISTTDTKDLKAIHKLLADEKELQELWKQHKKDDKSICEKTVKRFFIRKMNDLVSLVQPKLIVCMGKEAFEDFTDYWRPNTDVIFKNKKIKEKEYPVIGFSRNQTKDWKKLIPKIAEEIIIHQ